MATTQIPVLIIGAGPVGLVAACELKRHGIDCRIIDKKPTSTTTSNAVGVHPRSLDMWAAMGIYEKALSQGLKIEGIQFYSKKVEKLVDINFAELIKAPHTFILDLPQSQTEIILNEHLKSYGIEVEREKKLIGLEFQNEQIKAIIEKNNGEQEIVFSLWILACDGYHSTCRELVKIDYEGHDLNNEFIMIDAPLQWNLPKNKMCMFPQPIGAVAVFPMRETSRIIIEVSQDPSFDSKQPITRQAFIDGLKKRWSFDFDLGEERWISHFYIHERLAKTYQKDRLFLLGDAAHAHSPAGGQGMNTGMQDAYNLAWKLALVIKQKMHPNLLRTYEAERRPIAQTVLFSSDKMTKIATLRFPFFIKCRDFILKHLLSKKKIQAKFINQITGLIYHYRKSVLAKDFVKRSHVQAGDRAPSIIKDEKFVLLINESCAAAAEIEKLINANYADLITYRKISSTAEESQLFQLGQHYCLIRPDQYIASFGDCAEHVKAYFNLLA